MFGKVSVKHIKYCLFRIKLEMQRPSKGKSVTKLCITTAQQQPTTVMSFSALKFCLYQNQQSARCLLYFYLQKRAKKGVSSNFEAKLPCFSLHNVRETILQPFSVPICHQRQDSSTEFTQNAEQCFNHAVKRDSHPYPATHTQLLTTVL